MEGMALEEPGVFTAFKEDSHLDLHLDLLASGALHLLGGKAALNRPTLLSQFLWFDNLVTGIVSSVLKAPNRQFY